MPQLFCVLEEGGRALLTRAQGDIQAPSFPTVGLLSSIATYTENSGHELKVIASTNVRVIYRRFENHLLFVLVTSNLLLQTELLQLHLQTLFDALLLLLGSAALALDTTAKIDVLKKKLRGPGVQRAVDSLIADDNLVPCILLPVPQVVGLPLRYKASLQGALGKIVSTLGCQHAALISEGYYMAATHGWWTLLSPREQMLVQHLASQQAHDKSGDGPSELLLHVAKRQYEAPLRLRWLLLQEAVLLAVLFESAGPSPPPIQASEAQLRAHLHGVSQPLETPLWLSSPVPQFAPITFDVALVVEHSPPCATLLWGHGGSALQQGFNPLVSPTLRKQMGSSPSPMLAYRSPTLAREESVTAGGDGLQLFFRSAVDTLVSFVLQTWPQMPATLQATLHEAVGARVDAAGGAKAVAQGGPQARSASALTAPSSPHQQRSASPQQPSSPQQLDSPVSATRASPGASRLGLSSAIPALRRLSHSASSASRLHALFGRTSSAAGEAPPGNGAPSPARSSGGGAVECGEELGPAEPSELAHVAYEEVHAVVEGARLLAFLDRSGGGDGGCSARGAAGGLATSAAGAGVGGDGAVDVFMSFPRRVGRTAALEAAVTLRATYMMAYHIDEDDQSGR